MKLKHLGPLRHLLATQLDEEDFITLCFDFDIDPTTLPKKPAHKARELLTHLAVDGRIPELIQVGKTVCPQAPWDEAVRDWTQARLDTDMKLLITKRDWEDAERRARRERQQVVNVRPLDVSHTFRDRVHEAMALCRHFKDSSVRLVSVVGRGGMGKTALACHVLGDFEQGMRVRSTTGDCSVREGIPADLFSRLRATLLTCGPFDTDANLHTVFTDQRLFPWRDQVPQANSREARVLGVIDFLYPRAGNNMHNALVLLLNVLRDGKNPDDRCYQHLGELAADLQAWMNPGKEEEVAQQTAEILPLDGLIYLNAQSTGLSLERIYADVGRMLGDPMAQHLAQRWADRDTSLVAKVEYLLEHLQEGAYLILLDNMEDVLDADNTIKEEGLRLFVEGCMLQPGGVRLVVTSREEVQVAPAALRAMRRIALQDGLPEEDAIELLRDLDPQGELGLHHAPLETLQQVFAVTQGIPWALEKVASILMQQQINLAQLLEDRRLLDRDVLEQTLLHMGLESLGERERRVMETLAVFNRPVQATAVQFLLYPWFPTLDVSATLRKLVNSHFVIFNRATSEYSLHPLDREYVYQHIPEEGEDVTTQSGKIAK